MILSPRSRRRHLRHGLDPMLDGSYESAPPPETEWASATQASAPFDSTGGYHWATSGGDEISGLDSGISPSILTVGSEAHQEPSLHAYMVSGRGSLP